MMQIGNRQNETKQNFLKSFKKSYSSPGKIDTGKIDTFSEISRNFEKKIIILYLGYTELEISF